MTEPLLWLLQLFLQPSLIFKFGIWEDADAGMEASPLGKSLTILHQTQHQAVLKLHNEQQWHFEAVLQEQAESWWSLQKLLQSTTSIVVSPATSPHMMLTKLACTEDLENFLELFKHAAAMWEWMKEEWALRLLRDAAGLFKCQGHSLAMHEPDT